jgi:putrescine transport system ATP-binding protein
VIIDCADCRHYVGHGITGTAGMAVTVALRPEKIHLPADKPGRRLQHRARHDQGDVLLRQLHRLPAAAGQRRAAEGQHGQHAAPPDDEFTWGDEVWAHWSRSAHVVLTQ